jgi:hypothetical protein
MSEKTFTVDRFLAFFGCSGREIQRFRPYAQFSRQATKKTG